MEEFEAPPMFYSYMSSPEVSWHGGVAFSMEMYYNDCIIVVECYLEVDLTAILVLAGTGWFVPYPGSLVSCLR